MAKTEAIDEFNKYLTKRFWRDYDRLNIKFPILTTKGHITDIVKTKTKGVWQCINAGGGKIAFKLLNKDELRKIINRITNN